MKGYYKQFKLICKQIKKYMLRDKKQEMIEELGKKLNLMIKSIEDMKKQLKNKEEKEDILTKMNIPKTNKELYKDNTTSLLDEELSKAIKESRSKKMESS